MDEHDQHHAHSHEDDHSHHDHHKHMVSDFKRRFFISIIITIPILIISPMIQEFIGVDWAFPYDQYILFALSTIIFIYGGWLFITRGGDEIKATTQGMMTLLGYVIIIAYGYSTLTVIGWGGNNFVWELATLIDSMLLVHWIETKSVMGTSNALEELVTLIP